MTVTRYVDDILQTALLRYLKGHLHVICQQDNARRHIACQTMTFLQEARVNVLPFIELKSIKHVWDMMERRLSNLHHHPRSSRSCSE